MRQSRVFLAAAMAGASGSAASAQTATFQIDSIGSITLSGSVQDQTIVQQAAGSLATTYQGSVRVRLTPQTIEFPGGTNAAANNSGNWQPAQGGIGGSAPANYGGRATILFSTAFVAFRHTAFDLTGGSRSLAGSANNREFNANDLTFAATAGEIDYNGVGIGVDSEELDGRTGANAPGGAALLAITEATPGSGTARGVLTLPVSFGIETDVGGFGQGDFRFNGRIVASANARAGDTNFDGTISLLDFNVLAGNFGQTNRGWLGGDFNFDGVVNLRDFNALAANFGTSGSASGPTPRDWNALAAAVPEPSALTLVAASGALLRRRRAFRGNATALD